MRIILVPGHKSLPSGAASETFKARIAAGVRLMEEDSRYWILISGGITRKGLRSEADLGFSLVPRHLRHRVQLERDAVSTSANVTCVRRMLEGFRLDELVIVTSVYHVPRTRLLVKRYWPEVLPVARFVGVGQSSWWLQAKELALIAALMVDPGERLLFPALRAVKRAFT